MNRQPSSIRIVIIVLLVTYMYWLNACLMDTNDSASGTEVGNPENEIAVLVPELLRLAEDDSSWRLDAHLHPSLMNPSKESEGAFLAKQGAYPVVPACTSYVVETKVTADSVELHDTSIVLDTLVYEHPYTEEDTLVRDDDTIITVNHYTAYDSFYVADTLVNLRYEITIDSTVNVNRYLDCMSGINVVPLQNLPDTGSMVTVNSTDKSAYKESVYLPESDSVVHTFTDTSGTVEFVVANNVTELENSRLDLAAVNKGVFLSEGLSGTADYRDADGNGLLLTAEQGITARALLSTMLMGAEENRTIHCEFDAGEDRDFRAADDNGLFSFDLLRMKGADTVAQVLLNTDSSSGQSELIIKRSGTDGLISNEHTRYRLQEGSRSFADFRRTPEGLSRDISLSQGDFTRLSITGTAGSGNTGLSSFSFSAILTGLDDKVIEFSGKVDVNASRVIEGQCSRGGRDFTFHMGPDGKVEIEKK